MAVRACVIEGKGECNPVKLSEYQHVMRSLWDEISDLADFDKVNRSVYFIVLSFVFDRRHCLFVHLLRFVIFPMINYSF